MSEPFQTSSVNHGRRSTFMVWMKLFTSYKHNFICTNILRFRYSSAKISLHLVRLTKLTKQLKKTIIKEQNPIRTFKQCIRQNIIVWLMDKTYCASLEKISEVIVYKCQWLPLLPLVTHSKFSYKVRVFNQASSSYFTWWQRELSKVKRKKPIRV